MVADYRLLLQISQHKQQLIIQVFSFLCISSVAKMILYVIIDLSLKLQDYGNKEDQA
jgi:hypothetical protein